MKDDLFRCWWNDLEKVKQLLDEGADVNAKNKDGLTGLMHAAWKGHKEVVKLLLESGADVNAKDECGWTALKLALHFSYWKDNHNHKEIVELLKSYGAKE
jgi:ankyrin repeat protein